MNNHNLEPVSPPQSASPTQASAPDTPPPSMKADFIAKVKKWNKAKRNGPSKPKTPEYLSAKAEYRKQDGTVYRTQWEFGGAGRCDCPGFTFYHSCKHVKALRNGVGLENADEVAGD